ncbi:MAG TPA: Mur ligase family protein [SAR86 cluster bacterium]|jgi:dihydrofolate synthase/folylpolyglutamate synthase|nr:Mur ligase family protein [SAR86 cluster bacterium]|tara:strand:+ start:4064 stop:5260 length:1197 start_codon:yes stop_codon:yes gene_type:complete
MNSNSLVDWLEYINLNRSEEGQFGLKRLEPIKNIVLDSPIAKKVVVIGGTNGKGTAAEFLNNLLLKSNFKVGLYTSPHLFKFNERIRINGLPLSDLEIINAFKAIEEIKGGVRLTYFDYATIAAFIIFKKNSIDVAILEIGLGGKYDPVNLLDPDISILTNVELDHQKWLGNTREEIGEEKSEIFREGKTIIMGATEMPETVLQKAQGLNSKTLQLGLDFFEDEIKSNNLNKESAACSVAAYKEITDRQVDYKEILEKTTLLGRCDVNGKFILDVSHNLASVQNLVSFINKEFKGKSIKAIVGLMQDKDITGIIKEIKHVILEWYACSPDIDRAMPSADLKELILNETHGKVEAFESVDLAIKEAIKEDDTDMVIVFGSFFTVSEAYESLSKLKQIDL